MVSEIRFIRSEKSSPMAVRSVDSLEASLYTRPDVKLPDHQVSPLPAPPLGGPLAFGAPDLRPRSEVISSFHQPVSPKTNYLKRPFPGLANPVKPPKGTAFRGTFVTIGDRDITLHLTYR